MSEVRIRLADIVQWLRSTESELHGGAQIAGIKEWPDGAFADFDGAETMGRICVWSRGFFDFKVIRMSDGHQVFFRHEDVERTDDRSLDAALTAFVAALVDPGEK
jgi:hypothetical protein